MSVLNSRRHKHTRKSSLHSPNEFLCIYYEAKIAATLFIIAERSLHPFLSEPRSNRKPLLKFAALNVCQKHQFVVADSMQSQELTSSSDNIR
jgi:hypothetical protein